MRRIQAAVVLCVLTAFVLTASSFAAKSPGYSPSLTTSLQSSGSLTTSSVPAGTAYTISGCGYDASLGMVTVVVTNPVATQWVADTPDSNGCISISNFATEGTGSYKIDAWQHVRNKDQIVAEKTFTL